MEETKPKVNAFHTSLKQWNTDVTPSTESRGLCGYGEAGVRATTVAGEERGPGASSPQRRPETGPQAIMEGKTEADSVFSSSAQGDSLLNEFVLLEDRKLVAESIRTEIDQLKALYGELEKGEVKLNKARSDAEQDAEDLKSQTSKLRKDITEKAQEQIEPELTWQSNLDEAKKELETLTEKHKEVEGRLMEKKKKWATLDEEAKSLSVRPEKNMVFKGAVCDGQCNGEDICITPRILYPVSGGTALITFEKEKFAQKVLDIKEHTIRIDDCFVRVTASAVALPMPSSVAVDMSVCNCTILVSNIPIPDCMSRERLLDKLEIFFTKKKNGGGEVDCCSFLDDSGHVVITFAEDGVAKRLTSKGRVTFTLDGKNYDLKVTPYVKGDIKDLQFCDSTCRKTVQLTGIPDIMEKDALQDVLEIHFAKGSNGGGELEVVAYVPAGKSAIAVFEADNE